jgi:protein-S-isoprenylcysteine O-methyltransferase Ste14
MANNSLLRWRVPFGFVFAAWYLWLAQTIVPERLGQALIPIVLGCALRAWAAGYLLKGKRVAVGGPYAFVRNPLYLGSFLISLGFCWALYRTPLPMVIALFWVLVAAGFAGMYFAKSRSEEGELVRSLGPDYLRYRERVPAFFPTRGHVSGLGKQEFSRELYQRNREYQCLLGCLAVLGFLAWRAFASGM